ncbi:hypothetical protein BC827DRAFT_1158330 [Russula dissimulans]|nr:hypothetical protein BC827DRAFT_1158330 [Russula dissimulans]
MYEKHRRPLVHVYPPFPSLAWVMTAEANPPSRAYAHGYVQSAHAHVHRNTTRTLARISAHRAASCACHRPSSHSTRTPSPPSAWTRDAAAAAAAAATAAVADDEGLMETVDYRYHDPPSRRSYVPWHEGYTLSRQGAQQPKHHHHHHHHQQQPMQHAIPDSLFAVAAPEPRTVATTVARSIGDSDLIDVRPKKTTMTMTTTTIDVVKIKRRAVRALAFSLSGNSSGRLTVIFTTQIVLSALRRACGLSKNAAVKQSRKQQQ